MAETEDEMVDDLLGKEQHHSEGVASEAK